MMNMISSYISEHYIPLILSFSFLCVVGFCVNLSNIYDIRKNIVFSNDFLNDFNSFIKSKCKDMSLYERILKKSTRMQSVLGSHGIMSIRPPHAQYIIHNYQIILNFIPSIVEDYDYYCNLLQTTSSLQNPVETQIRTIYEIITRYIGEGEHAKTLFKRRLIQPLQLFSDGFYFICNIPIKFLLRMGLMTTEKFDKIINSTFYKLLLFVLFILSIYSDVLTVYQGHESFFSIFQTWIDSSTNP